MLKIKNMLHFCTFYSCRMLLVENIPVDSLYLENLQYVNNGTFY